jgi:hypothetical protein
LQYSKAWSRVAWKTASNNSEKSIACILLYPNALNIRFF